MVRINIINKQKIVVAFSWAALLFWGIIIFLLSQQSADNSNELSKELTEKIIKIIDNIIGLEADSVSSINRVEQTNNITRKCAHFGMYFILGILAINAFMRTRFILNKAFFFSAILCLIYAISDEFHQKFIPGRSGEIRDMLIDTIGAIIGIGLIWLIKQIRHHKSLKINSA